MSLLTAHKILVSAALALSLILVVWGAVHAVVRGEANAWVVLLVGALAAPAAALYLRKLKRDPPIH